MRTGKEVSFYEVPLVCNAVTHIGCGSRSKPVLLDLQNESLVKRAWLNRPGTIIALEWKDAVNSKIRQQITADVFRKHELPAEEMQGKTFAQTLESFTSDGQWLAGSQVDELSKEEAGVFADRLISITKRKSELNESQEKKFRQEIQDIFYDFFVNYESLEQLSDMNIYKEKVQQVIKLGEKYTGRGNMPNTNSLLGICCKNVDCSE